MISLGGNRSHDIRSTDWMDAETHHSETNRPSGGENSGLTTMSISNNQGKNKNLKRPYMKLFTSDYRDGTARLSFEQQGFYARILTILHDGDTVPADARALGVMMQCDPRKAARLARELVSAGKLYEANGELRNKRIDRDAGETSAELRDDVEETSPGLQRDFAEKSERTFQKTESNQSPPKHYYGEGHSHSHIQIEELAAAEQEPAREPPSRAAPPINFDELEAKLVAACNGSLDNPVNCQGLLNLSVPQMWLQQGYDLETEIIPTLRAAGKKHHGKRIRDWSYFTPIIAENRAKRSKVAKPAAPVDRSNMTFVPPMYGKPGYWAPKQEAAQ